MSSASTLDGLEFFQQCFESFKRAKGLLTMEDEHQSRVKFLKWVVAKVMKSRRSLGKNDSKVTYKEAEPFTTRVKTPDSSKAKRDLGFKLTVPIEEGMRRTVEWFKAVYVGNKT